MTPPLAQDTATTGGFRAFRSRNFALLWVGNLLSNIGTWMQSVAEPWLVLQLSNSPFLVGLDSFATTGPIWFLILAGGVLADQGDRRRTILLYQGIQLACPAALVVLLLLGKVTVTAVILLSLIVGITDALSGPALMALIPSVVPVALVPNAVALNSVQFNLSRVIGPLLAGAAMAGLGATACFAFNTASYVPLLVAVLLVRPTAAMVKDTRDGRARGPQTGQASLREALGLVAKTDTLRRPLLTVLISGLFCAPIVTFAPVLVRDSLHRGSGTFSGTLSAYGVGGLVGAGVVLILTTNRARQRASTFAALAVGLLVILIAVYPHFLLVLVAFALIGGGMVTTNASANTILQSSIDSRLRGRMSSLYTLALRGSLALGSVATGVVVSHAGVGRGLLVDGILALVGQLWLMTSTRDGKPAGRSP